MFHILIAQSRPPDRRFCTILIFSILYLGMDYNPRRSPVLESPERLQPHALAHSECKPSVSIVIRALTSSNRISFLGRKERYCFGYLVMKTFKNSFSLLESTNTPLTFGRSTDFEAFREEQSVAEWGSQLLHDYGGGEGKPFVCGRTLLPFWLK